MRIDSRINKDIKRAMQNSGQFFTVIAKLRDSKRPNELRRFVYQWKNSKALKGGELGYDKDEKNLFIGYDWIAKGWRAVNCDDIAFIACNIADKRFLAANGLNDQPEDVNPTIVVNDLNNYKDCKNYDLAMKSYQRIKEKQGAIEKDKGILEIMLEKKKDSSVVVF